jgi:acetylglutamate kinase
MKHISVVKFGGSLTKNLKTQNKFLKKLAEMSKKESIVLVHGGGPEINFLLNKFKIKSNFVKGLRFTDAETLEIVELALNGKINGKLTAGLIKNGANAVGISGRDGKTIICKRIKSLGFVGLPIAVNKKLIVSLLKEKFLPVVAPIALDKKNNVLNVNADSAASIIASSLKADKLIFLTDTDGVLDKNKKTIKEIKVKNIDGLIKSGTITGGMLPKIKSCGEAVKKGVKEVLIIDGVCGIKKNKGTVIRK